MGSRRDPEEILAEWIELVSDSGGESFDELLARHPKQRGELSRLHAAWMRLQSFDRRVQPAELIADDPERESSRYSGVESLGREGLNLRAGARLGQYELERQLGRGGMGVVWAARDLMLSERVALKFLPHILVTDRLAMMRLRREAKVLLALTHLNIVRLRTVEAKQGLTFLVEECLGGPTLEDVVEERVREGERGLSAEEALWVLDEVSPALEYAHGEGVTHRDLKPSNLMLDVPPDGELGMGEERAKLTDFGLAFVATSALSQISGYRPTGTLPYMAPEVLMGRKPTPAADVYGLGATIYHLVAGEPAFAHGDLATQILHREPEPLSSGNADLDLAVAAAMRKNPAERPASVEEFCALAFGEISPPRRVRELPVRRLAAAAGVVCGLVLMLLLILWGPWRDQRAPEPRDTPAAAVEPLAATQPTRPPALASAAVELDLPFVDGNTFYLSGDERGLVMSGRVVGPHTGPLEVFVDSVRHEVTPDDEGHFVFTSGLIEGREHPVRIEGDGVFARAFSVVLDHTPPVLTRRAPLASVLDVSRVRVEVHVADPNLESVRLEGEEMRALEGGIFEATDVVLRPGSQTLRVVARDRSGNEGTLELELSREATAPELTDVSPAPRSSVYVGEEVRFELAFEHRIERATLGGTPLALNETARRASGTLVVPRIQGVWTPTFQVRDELGLEAQGELSYRVLVRPRTVRVADRELVVLSEQVGIDRLPWRVRDDRTGLTFRLVEPGEFRMGRDDGDRFEEGPQRPVRIDEPYYVAETETTLATWRGFVAETSYRTTAELEGGATTRAPGDTGAPEEARAATWQAPLPNLVWRGSDRHPVTQVSYRDCVTFCEHYGYRLPSEAEWEYACRAGSEMNYFWSDDVTGSLGRGNFASLETSQMFSLAPRAQHSDGFAITAPVASYGANAWGIHDMLGNVWEWCADEFDLPRADEAPVPRVETADAERPRVLRGGSWLGTPETVTRRAFDFPDRATDTRGFRVVFTP